MNQPFVIDEMRLGVGRGDPARRARRVAGLIRWERLFLVWRLVVKDIRHHAAEALLLLLAIAAAAATLTLGLSIHGATNNPYASRLEPRRTGRMSSIPSFRLTTGQQTQPR